MVDPVSTTQSTPRDAGLLVLRETLEGPMAIRLARPDNRAEEIVRDPESYFRDARRRALREAKERQDRELLIAREREATRRDQLRK